MRIVSLVPSITETLFDFGLTHNEVVGRTKFCIHPGDLVQNVEVIGGTKNLKIEKNLALKPDLIIANKEENEKLQVEELAKHCRVWVTNIATLADNERFIWELGMVLKKRQMVNQLTHQINEAFPILKANIKRKKAAYLIWSIPYMTVGCDTFINEILDKLGFENVFKNQKRYPEISVDELKEADLIFLSSEPFPFQQKHLDELQKELPNNQIILVDGEAFSWFGTHLIKVGDYLKKLSENYS